MDTEETEDKGDKTNSTNFGFAPMGQGMFEMMNTCCTGQGGLPECSMMKSMMDSTRNQRCCTSQKKNIPKEKENEEFQK